MSEERLALKMVQVVKRFKQNIAVDGIDLNVVQGECFGLLGPNGAGKTTTLRMALGLSRASEGSIQLLGYDLPKQALLARQRVGVVPQLDALDPDFTVKENLQVFASYFGLKGAILEQKITQLLEFASLDKRANDRVTDLSAGLKRRLTLARALLNDPDMVFLDEPSTALDPQARHMIWERLQQLREQGKTLLLTTHFMEEAQRLCDRVAVLDKGQIVALGSPRELIKQHIGAEVLELFGRQVQQWLSQNKPILQNARIDVRGETAFIYAKDLKPFLQALDQCQEEIRPEYLYRPANLEDVFLRLTGRDLRDN